MSAVVNPSATAARLTRASDTALDAAVVALALWTAVYHLALVVGLTRDPATAVWVALLVGAAVAAWIARGGRRPAQWALPVGLRPWWASAALAALGAGLAVAAGATILDRPAWWGFWAAALVVAGGAAALAWRAPRAEEAPPRRPGLAAVSAVLVVAVAFSVLSAFTQRPDSDDVFLMNKALHTEADSGEFALRDTIFADEVFRSTRPEVSETTFEPLVGVLARWSPFTSPTVAYLLLAPLASALGVLALWRLLRTLRARAPALATVAAATWLALDGAEHASFGNFSFGRAWQGKVVFVFVVVPLLWHHALRWSRDGDRRSLLLLVISTVAGVGLTSTATLVAPAVVVVASVAGAPRATSRHLWSLAGLVYPVGAATVGLARSEGAGVREGAVELAAGAGPLLGQVAGHQSGLEPTAQWYLVFGDGFGMFLGTAAALLGWLAVRERSARLVFALAPAVVFLVFLTPGALHLMDAYTGARSVLWRAIWVIPVPAAMGVLLTAPLPAIRDGVPVHRNAPVNRGAEVRRGAALRRGGALRRDARVRRGAAVLLPVVALGALAVTEEPVISEANRGARFGHLAWDVDPGDRAAAERLAARGREGDVAAAPQRVGQALAVTTVAVRPVNPRARYLSGDHTVAEFHASERHFVSQAVTNGFDPDQGSRFRAALDVLSVDVACTRPQTRGEPVETALERAGFERVDADDQCTYWSRAHR